MDIGLILGRSCAHVGLTSPRDNIQSHFLKTSHAKSSFSSSTQCPKVAPRWSQDGLAWLKMALRFNINGVFAWEVLKKWTLASSWGHLGEVLFTRWLNITTRQHTKPFFKDLPRKICIFKLASVPQGGPKMVPRWPSMAQDGLKMAYHSLSQGFQTL